MIDINFLRQHSDMVQKKSAEKKVVVDVSHILEIDKKRHELQLVVQKLQEQRNLHSSSIKGKPTEVQLQKGREIKEKLEKEEHALSAVEEELKEWLYKIPNMPKEDVKVGKDETENDVIRKYKEPTTFSFTPKDHLTLGVTLDIIDVDRASKVSGPRFAYLKNDAVLLEFALIQYALEVLIKEGFIPVIPPALIKRDVMRGLGYMEHGADEDIFSIDKDNLMLIGTAEHTIVTMHKDELLQKKDLPKRYVGFSSAFRREAGSYGKDTKGILRVHQFDKVEMVSFVEKEKDDEEHEYLLSLEEKFFQSLGIPYQVIKMCTGDIGFVQARKYDIEAWIPSQNKYRELTSASTITDFQSRRLNIKYQDSNERKFAHVLNGTAFAIGRTIIAILENYQQEDGSIKIPHVLQKFINKTVIKSRL